MSPDEREYYRNRAQTERLSSARASNPRVAEIHDDLATLYETLVELEEEHPPAQLRVVA